MTISHEPNFSSPNISSSDNLAPVETATPAPQTVTGTDVSAMAGTDAGAIATAAAAMPENDAPGAIGSGTISSQTPAMAQPTRTHFGLSNRRYNATAPQPAQPAFVGAPDYFNQAAGDIILNEQHSNKRNKLLIICVAIFAVIVALLVVIILMRSSKTIPDQSTNREISEEIIDDAMNIRHLEARYNEIARGDIDIYAIMEEGYCDEIGDGISSYNVLKPKITDYVKKFGDNYEHLDEFKKIESALLKEDIFSGLDSRCRDVVDYVSGKSSGVSEEYGEKYKNAAIKLKNAYSFKIPSGLSCPEEAEVVVPACQEYWKKRSERKELLLQSNKLIKDDIFGIKDSIGEDAQGGKMLFELTEKLNNGAIK